MRRYWWLPLLVAGVLDVLLVTHGLLSPGARVNGAVRHSLAAAQCQETLLVRSLGAPDQLTVFNVTPVTHALAVVDMQAEFSAGGTLTAASTSAIAAGQDTSISLLPLTGTSAHPLLQLYTQDLHDGTNWMTTPCLPLPNPRTSHLRASGTVRAAGQSYLLYLGSVNFSRSGTQVFARSAQVWMGVGKGDTLGFTVVRGQLRATGVDTTYATMYAYSPGRPTGIVPPAATAVQRVQLYDTQHAEVDDLLNALGFGGGASLSA